MNYLLNIKSLHHLKQLFTEEWNWDLQNFSNFLDIPQQLKEKVLENYLFCQKLNFNIFLTVLQNLQNPEREIKSIERKLLNYSPIKQLIDNSIFVFSTEDFGFIDFVKAEKIGQKIKIKRFLITPDNRDKLRTAEEQLQKLKLPPHPEYSQIKNLIEEAFSVEAVTNKFYNEFENIFRKIKKELVKQKLDISSQEKEVKLREFVHQILNRIMFLYFVQKRGCFNGDKNFLKNFWNGYKERFKGKDKFYKEWLEILFFEALSKQSWLYKEKPYLEQFNEILKNAPYLNGGLFERNDLDKIGWYIPDDLFEEIFEFFESYNFTVTESTPLDIEIAIDPEMLGNIYEHMVNIEEFEEEGKKAGVFYTPKTEIEFMIKRSLVEFLFNKTKISKEKLYQFIFPEQEEEITDPFTPDEAQKVLDELENILILDPACGSGHYLVVAAQILYDLKEILWQKLNKKYLDKYSEKKKIIERNIYGNDIKKWATEVAKLRLWLDIFIDAPEEVLKSQNEAILPNLNFKIRCGDSLIQKLGNKLVSIRTVYSKVDADELKELIKRKEAVYENKLNNKEALVWEKKILQNTISKFIIEKKQKIQNKNQQICNLQHPELGVDNKKSEIDKEKIEELKKEIEYLQKELERLVNFKTELDNKKLEEIPMLWDLSFAEVFKMKKGFDIVIANPPYVRQEQIEDLTGAYPKQEYKEKLIEQTILDWSYNYEGKLVDKYGSENCFHPIPQKFDKKCDLYVYFYLKGLKLLNPNGVLCYISSNSWLDVSYGRILQEVLLKKAPIVAIYDNQVKRSFKHADVNTIIALMKAPKENYYDNELKNNDVRFVNFKKSFEEIMYSEIFIDLEKNYNLKEFQEGKRRETETYRLHIINQNELHEIGKDKQTQQYIGNKWGGKYLRAPEIYWKILEKGRGKFVRLGDVAEVRFGIKTGANEFFYVEDVTDKINFGETKYKIKNLGDFKTLDEIKKAGLRIVRNTKTDDYWLIEEEFLKPVIKSPRECKSILIKPEDLKYKVLMVHKSKKELKGKKVLDYIEWGEKQGFHKRPTCRSRKQWWELEGQQLPMIILFMFEDERKFSCFNKYAFVDAAIYCVYSSDENLTIYFNSTLFALFKELLSRAPEGLGALQMKVYDYERLPAFSIETTPKKISIIRPIKSIFTELGFDPSKPIRQQEPNPLPDRKALDDIVFDALGLTEEERKEVYWAVAELVQNRLQKAKSV